MITSLAASVILMVSINIGMEIEPWRAINDGVMGGISSGAMRSEGPGLRFTGELSLENNGGCASVRRLVDADLAETTGVRLEVRGDGREYQFRIRQDGRFDGVAWRVKFQTDGSRQTLDFGFDEFEPVFRGRAVDAGPVEPAAIAQVGFMIADRRPGAFQLEIRNIEFIAADS